MAPSPPGASTATVNATSRPCLPDSDGWESRPGTLHTLARRSDGTVAAWGENGYGQCNVPALAPGLSYTGIAAGYAFSVACLSSGSIVGWGFGPAASAPSLPPGVVCVELAAGLNHALARLSDGSVIAWGINTCGQCNVPALPAGVTYVGIAAGNCHSLARRSDGAVVAWGDNYNGQCNVPPPPAGASYVEIAAGYGSSVARYELPHPVLECSQPGGPGSGVFVSNSLLVPGQEHCNAYSMTLSPGVTGSGPWGGLYFSSYSDILGFLLLPLGTDPFHFISPAPSITFGPYPIVPGYSLRSGRRRDVRKRRRPVPGDPFHRAVNRSGRFGPTRRGGDIGPTRLSRC